MYFCLYRMHIDAIILNRIFPEGVRDAYFKEWKKSQETYRKKAEEYFSPLPILSVPLFREEVLGYEQLKRLAEEVYAGKNPLDHFYSGELYRLEKKDGVYQLRLKLPFVSKEDIVLNTFPEELSIRVGGYRRLIPLPRPVAGASSVRAKMEGETLLITFGGDKNA